MLAVLLLLVLVFSLATISPQSPEGAGGGRNLAKQILKAGEGQRVFIVAQDIKVDREFARAVGVRFHTETEFFKAIHKA